MIVERATIQLDLTTSRHVGMGQSPEAGYNLEEAHHTGWKPELAVLVGAYGLRRQGTPQCGLQRQDTTIWPGEARIPQLEIYETGFWYGIAYNADTVTFERPHAATTRKSSLLPESHD